MSLSNQEVILTFIFSGHSDPKTVECKTYYKYAKKIRYESKEVKHCHDEPSVECENLMKMCHEEPEEVCGVKTEKGIFMLAKKNSYLKYDDNYLLMGKNSSQMYSF